MRDIGHASYHDCQCKWVGGSSTTTGYHVKYASAPLRVPSTHVVEGWVGLKTELDWYRGENISPPPAFELRIVRPVVNRHTDNAIPVADINMR